MPLKIHGDVLNVFPSFIVFLVKSSFDCPADMATACGVSMNRNTLRQVGQRDGKWAGHANQDEVISGLKREAVKSVTRHCNGGL
jgi:hypothetical protein